MMMNKLKTKLIHFLGGYTGEEIDRWRLDIDHRQTAIQEKYQPVHLKTSMLERKDYIFSDSKFTDFIKQKLTAELFSSPQIKDLITFSCGKSNSSPECVYISAEIDAAFKKPVNKSRIGFGEKVMIVKDGPLNGMQGTVLYSEVFHGDLVNAIRYYVIIPELNEDTAPYNVRELFSTEIRKIKEEPYNARHG